MKILGFVSGVIIVAVLLALLFMENEFAVKWVSAPKASFNYNIKERSSYGLFLASQYARMNHDFTAAGDLLAGIADKKDAPIEVIKDTYSILAADGKMAEAAKYARKALLTHKEDLLPALIIAAVEAKKGNYKEAAVALESIPTTGQNKYFKSLLKTWIWFGQGEKDKAFNEIEALAGEPVFTGAYRFHKALLNDMAGKVKEAQQNYEIVLGKNKEKASIRSTQVAISFYRRTGQPDKAEELLEAYRRDPQKQAYVGEDFLFPASSDSPIATPVQGLAEAFLGIAANLTTTKNYDLALLLMQMSLYLDPDLIVGQVLLGEIFENEKMYDKAEKVYAGLPKSGEIYKAGQMRRVEILGQQGKHKESIAVLKEIIKENPEETLPLIALGDAYRNMEKFTKAAKIYTKVMEKIGKDAQIPWSLYYSRGVSLERTGKWDAAEDDLLTALAKNPANPMILNYLGYSWLEQGKHILKAREMIAKAVEQKPDDGYIMDSFGWAFYITKDYDKAVKVLEIALELEPSNSLILSHLGDAYWKVGRKREARFQWKKALNFNIDLEKGDYRKIKFKLEHGLDEFEKKESKKHDNIRSGAGQDKS